MTINIVDSVLLPWLNNQECLGLIYGVVCCLMSIVRLTVVEIDFNGKKCLFLWQSKQMSSLKFILCVLVPVLLHQSYSELPEFHLPNLIARFHVLIRG